MQGFDLSRTGNSWFPSRPHVAANLPSLGGISSYFSIAIKVIACAAIAFIAYRAIQKILCSRSGRPGYPYSGPGGSAVPHSKPAVSNRKTTPTTTPSPQKVSSKQSDGEECTICFEEFKQSEKVYFHESVAEKVQHIFHTNCLDKAQKRNPNLTCPICLGDTVEFSKKRYSPPKKNLPQTEPIPSTNDDIIIAEIDCSTTTRNRKKNATFALHMKTFDLDAKAAELTRKEKVYAQDFISIFFQLNLNATKEQIAQLMLIKSAHPDSFCYPEKLQMFESSTEEGFVPYLKGKDARNFIEDCFTRNAYINENLRPNLSTPYPNLAEID